MASARCAACKVGYPQSYSVCEVCEGRLVDVADPPDADWRQRVASLQLERARVEREDEKARLERDGEDARKVVAWRLHVLLELGVACEQAEALAERHHGPERVDVHRLAALIGAGCAVETAVRIVA